MSAALARVLEPEVMDSPEEAHDYDAMDHAGVNRVFVDDFLRIWDNTGPILDVGTGTAQIPIHLCSRSADAVVVGVDLAENMLTVGHANVKRASLQQRIRLERCDAKALPFSTESFAAIISNSIMHHIPEPEHVLKEMVRVLVPGGTIFVRDLLRPNSDAELRRLVELYAGDANEHQQRMFGESLHAALTLDEIRHLVEGLDFNPAKVRQTTDRHWTWWARKPK